MASVLSVCGVEGVKIVLFYRGFCDKNMTQNEAALKLSELLVKVEMFRVIVRNVASHKTTLTQSAVEHGINISIVQENSILKLLDELFGDFLNKKYVDQIVNSL